MGKWLALYEECALPVQQKYLGNLIGFFQTEIGTLNQVVHLWGFADLDDRARRRAEMAKDPAWHDFLRKNEELARCCIRNPNHRPGEVLAAAIGRASATLDKIKKERLVGRLDGRLRW